MRRRRRLVMRNTLQSPRARPPPLPPATAHSAIDPMQTTCNAVYTDFAAKGCIVFKQSRYRKRKPLKYCARGNGIALVPRATPGLSGTPRRPGSALRFKCQKTNNKSHESSKEQRGKLQMRFGTVLLVLELICDLSFVFWNFPRRTGKSGAARSTALPRRGGTSPLFRSTRHRIVEGAVAR
jgi:hypothetical protein